MSSVKPAPSTTVRAAGAVCWSRVGDGPDSLRVLVVHRPKYDDWSWPKGKLDAGEPDAAAAVREVAEETGLRVRLGVSLPTARYRLSEVADKSVNYWAAQVDDCELPPAPRPDEVDRAEWVTIAEADRRLTRRGDRLQLQSLTGADENGTLDTWPLVVVRHTDAHPRRSWTGDEADRPLTPSGERQAVALADLLRAWAPERLWSSPWRRCLDSVQPYRETAGVPVKTAGRLSEAGHRKNPRKAASLLSSFLDDGSPVAICTHRPVLGTLLGTLAGHAAAGLRGKIPTKDPFLAAGELLVAHVSRRSGRVVAVERHAVRSR